MALLTVHAQELETVVPQLIVKFRDGGERNALPPPSRVSALAADTGVVLAHSRAMALGAHVVRLFRALPIDEAERLAAQFAAHPDVEYVQLDHFNQPLFVPNDPYVNQQTYLDNAPGGINAYAAWDLTLGSSSIVVAVIDSGLTGHPDLGGRILPGYDFISDPKIANDGDGRDPSAADPGDWMTAADLADPFFAARKFCKVEDSTWHGTAVAGVIAATGNNDYGIAGLDWLARVLPVRVLGKCGGPDSDIIDGIAWAAGLSVPGVPANANPAHVLNLSLGRFSDAPCGSAYEDVFAQALAHGVTRAIIAAAGNASEDVAGRAPANCPGVIAVAATNRSGSLTSYSNFGSAIVLSAPGGEYPTDPIYTLDDFGTTAPMSPAVGKFAGTSFSAPMISGVVSLMLSVAPGLTSSRIRSILTSTAKPFPVGSTCDTTRCGAGIVDADAAVAAAQSSVTGGEANYQGLWWASGGAESGWGINFAHQGDRIFATWYTYDTTGKAWWLSMLTNKTAGSTYSGPVYVDTGPPFNSFVGTGNAMPVGKGTLTFGDANNGTFTYTLNAGTGGSSVPVVQTKSIARYDLYNGAQVSCAFDPAANLALATNYQDLWWEASGTESGWGINFAHQGDRVFLTWYTYDSDGAPLWLSALTLRVGTSNIYTGPLLRTSGPRFDNYKASDVVQPIPTVGTATLTFVNGNAATFNYTTNGSGGLPPGVSQTKPIVRFAFTTGGTVCH